MESPTQRVTVTDVQMPFGSMVVFIFKWAIASIPAMLLLIVVGAAAAGLIGGMMGGLLKH